MTNIAIAMICICVLIVGLVWRTESHSRKLNRLAFYQMCISKENDELRMQVVLLERELKRVKEQNDEKQYDSR